MSKKLSLLIKQLLSYFPSKLPVGRTAFTKWADDIIELAGELADRDSIEFVLSSAIQHASSNRGYVPKNYFVNTLIKAAANQVAAQVFQDVKIKQQEAAKLAAAIEQAKQAEVTAATSEAVTESVKNN